jgi:outer membrane protein assembly factor BamE
MNKSVFWLGLIASLTCTACGTVLSNLPGIYKLDIEQGNMLDQSMIDQLRPNMSKRQVQFIMGTPMIVDIFHDERWDYIYSKEPSGEDRVQKRVSLYFKGDNLQSVQGDFRPSSMPVVKPSTETSIELPKREFDQSMWQKVANLFGFDPGVDTDDGVTPNATNRSSKSAKSR